MEFLVSVLIGGVMALAGMVFGFYMGSRPLDPTEGRKVKP